MKREFNLEKQIEHFKKTGKCIDPHGDDHCNNFYDWFCKDTSLPIKATALMNKVIKFVEVNPQIDQKKYYVWFKNNCPMNGPLYDDFRLADIESGDVKFNVCAKSGHTGKAEVYTSENGWHTPFKTAVNFTELLKQYQ